MAELINNDCPTPAIIHCCKVPNQKIITFNKLRFLLRKISDFSRNGIIAKHVVRHLRKIVRKLKIQRIGTLKKIEIKSEIEIEKTIRWNYHSNGIANGNFKLKVLYKTGKTCALPKFRMKNTTSKFTRTEKIGRNGIGFFFLFFKRKTENLCFSTESNLTENTKRRN